jgi:hypothetical protein
MCNYYGRTTTSTAVFSSIGALSVVAGVTMVVLGWLPPKKVLIMPEASATGAKLSVGVNF